MFRRGAANRALLALLCVCATGLPQLKHAELPCHAVSDPSLESHGSTTGELRGPEEPKYLLWTGPGSGGLGNTILSFLTAFYDAMRSGRRIARVSVPEVGKFCCHAWTSNRRSSLSAFLGN